MEVVEVQVGDCYVVKVLDRDDYDVCGSDGSNVGSAGFLDDDVWCKGIVETRDEVGLRARCHVEVVC